VVRSGAEAGATGAWACVEVTRQRLKNRMMNVFMAWLIKFKNGGVLGFTLTT
jgi:hypothetical protein